MSGGLLYFGVSFGVPIVLAILSSAHTLVRSARAREEIFREVAALSAHRDRDRLIEWQERFEARNRAWTAAQASEAVASTARQSLSMHQQNVLLNVLGAQRDPRWLAGNSVWRQ